MKKLSILFALFLILNCGRQSTEPKKIPQISVAPKVTTITTSTADVSWETDIAATSVVRYGEKSGLLDYTVQNENQSTSHFIRLDNMKSGTPYYYIAESSNKDGSATSVEFSFSTLPSLDQMFTSAWTSYQQKNYTRAIALFSSILKDNQRNASALSGMGWCYIATPVDSLGKAIYYFDLAVVAEANYVDALAGRGLTLIALKNYNKAIIDLNKVLMLNPSYIFVNNPTVDVRDLRLALAMAYFYKQDYVNAQTQINNLAPKNGLNPEDNATWGVDGATYAGYREALLGWLEKLARP